MILIWALMLNYGNLYINAKGKAQAGNCKADSTDGMYRGGQVCSSDEVMVIIMERRDLAT